MAIKSFYKKHGDKILAIAAYFICIITAFWTIETKNNYGTDEVFTYGLSNHLYDGQYEMSVIEGKKYEPAGEAWYDYMVVQEGEGFNYANVWKNQSEDVHPILYYVIVHTLSSFFPGRFSRWFAGIVNLVFITLTLYVVRKIVKRFADDKWMLLVSSIVFSLCGGVLIAVEFFRMYIMAMFFVTLFTWLLMRLYSEGMKRELGLKLLAVSVMGALTHYYVTLYIVLACVVCGILILSKKRFGDFARFAVCMVAAAGIAVLIFPSMINHLLVSDRGGQSVENLVENSLQTYLDSLKIFWSIINQYLFGGILALIAFLFVAVLVVKKLQKQEFKPMLGGGRL